MMMRLSRRSIFVATVAVLALMFIACGDGSSGSGDDGSPPSNDPPSNDPPSNDPPSDDPPPVAYDSKVTVSVSIRDESATISISAPGTLNNSYTLYASREENCDVDSYVYCSVGEKRDLSAATPSAEVTALTAAKRAYFILKNEDLGVSKSFTVTPHPFFSPRYLHQVVVFDNKPWLIGGSAGSGGFKNDVWSSADGTTWNQVTTRNQEPTVTEVFSPRYAHQVVVFDSKLWLIGGWSYGYNRKNDVWSSADGTTWNQVTTRNQEPTVTEVFDPRFGHQVVVFKEQLWLIGGWNYNYFNDVWRSEDGETWSEVTTRNQEPTVAEVFSARRDHQVVVFQDKLWVIGGSDFGSPNGGRKNDIWSSADGADWTKVTDEAAFSARQNHQVVVFDNKLWVIGGYADNGRKNDIWSSADGADWTKVTDEAVFSPRDGHQVVVFDNKLWVIGGNVVDNNSFRNDVWSSDDGSTWRRNGIHEQTVPLTFR